MVTFTATMEVTRKDVWRENVGKTSLVRMADSVFSRKAFATELGSAMTGATKSKTAFRENAIEISSAKIDQDA